VVYTQQRKNVINRGDLCAGFRNFYEKGQLGVEITVHSEYRKIVTKHYFYGTHRTVCSWNKEKNALKTQPSRYSVALRLETAAEQWKCVVWNVRTNNIMKHSIARKQLVSFTVQLVVENSPKELSNTQKGVNRSNNSRSHT